MGLGSDAETILGSPSAAPEANVTSIDVASEVQSIDRNNLQLFVGTAEAIKQLNDSSLVDIDVLSIDGSSPTAGAIRATTTLSDGSAFYVAENGFFYGDGTRLAPSPLGATVQANTIHAASASTTPDGEDRLWLGATGVLYRLEGEALETWKLGSNEPVTAVGETSDVVLVAQGEQLEELALDGSSSRSVHLDSGTIHQILRHTDGATYLATDGGLVVRTTNGAYLRYSMSESEDGIPVTALSSDPLAGLYLRTEQSVVRAVGETFIGVAQVPLSTEGRLAIDFHGDAWVTTSDGIAGYFVAPDLSFEQDGVKVALSVCGNCHSEQSHESAGAPFIPFDDHGVASSYAGRIEARLSDASNPMPPAPYTFSTDDYQRVLRWISTGSNP